MNKITILSIAVVVLIVLNTVAVCIFFIGKPREKRPEPREMIINYLRLDKKQELEYEKSIHKHRRNLDKLEMQMEETKQQLYNAAVLEKLAANKWEDSIASIVKQIETANIAHLSEIESICKPEQKAKFKQMIAEINTIFRRPKHPRQH